MRGLDLLPADFLLSATWTSCLKRFKRPTQRPRQGARAAAWRLRLRVPRLPSRASRSCPRGVFEGRRRAGSCPVDPGDAVPRARLRAARGDRQRAAGGARVLLDGSTGAQTASPRGDGAPAGGATRACSPRRSRRPAEGRAGWASSGPWLAGVRPPRTRGRPHTRALWVETWRETARPITLRGPGSDDKRPAPTRKPATRTALLPSPTRPEVHRVPAALQRWLGYERGMLKMDSRDELRRGKWWR